MTLDTAVLPAPPLTAVTLAVRGLTVGLTGRAEPLVHGVDLDVREGETVGIVGSPAPARRSPRSRSPACCPGASRCTAVASRWADGPSSTCPSAPRARTWPTTWASCSRTRRRR